MNIEIPRQAKSVLERLEGCGYEAYVVGGCVRDSLLHIAPNDWDITTNARPEEVAACCEGLRVIETGIQHGTVTVVCESMPLEVTTYRVDGQYSDNRHPDSVFFTRSLKEDLCRRDFTINAMAYSPLHGLVDYFGGDEDLQNKTIRCVGDANQRFREDALRILRALRFASRFGYRIEPATKEAVFNNKALLLQIAAERIQTELNGLLCGPGAEEILNTFADVLAVFIPELTPLFGFNQKNRYHHLDVWRHTTASVACAPNDVTVRLAMLLHDIGKPQKYSEDAEGVGHFYGHQEPGAKIAFAVLKRLKYDNSTVDAVTTLVLHHDADVFPRKRSIRRWLNKIGETAFRQLLFVKAADICAQNPDMQGDRLLIIDEIRRMLDEVIAQKQCFRLADLAVDGRDLMALGIPEGERIGAVLKTLLDRVMDEKLENDKTVLLKAAKELYRAGTE